MRRALAFAACLVGCGGPSTAPPAPGPPILRLDPPSAIAFEPISADAVAVSELEVLNEGAGELIVEALSVVGGRADAWHITPSIELGEAIAPGARAQVRVEYRPCPLLLRGGERCDCGPELDTATLSIKTNAQPQVNLLALSASATAPGPRIEVDPAFELALGQASTATVTVRNAGCGPLRLHGVDLSGPGGAFSASVDDFRMQGCEGWPQALDMSLCAQGCDASQAELRLDYDNNDQVADEVAELHLSSNDPWAAERTLLVTAEGPPACLPPIGRVQTSTHPCIERSVDLDARLSVPSGPEAPIVGYAWSFAFTHAPEPALIVGADARTAHFVPQRSGLYIVALELSTDCGPAETVLTNIFVEATGCH